MYTMKNSYHAATTLLNLIPDELFEVDRYLSRNIKYRLAFREFGTSLGIKCHSEKSSDKERAIDLKSYSDAVLSAWEPYMEISLSPRETSLTPEDLRPITRVMYSSALIPGG
jgi:hypothetical protein